MSAPLPSFQMIRPSPSGIRRDGITRSRQPPLLLLGDKSEVFHTYGHDEHSAPKHHNPQARSPPNPIVPKALNCLAKLEP